MKTGVEAGHLRDARQTLGNRVDCREVVRLMQRGERNELAQLLEDLPSHDRRAGEARAAMDDAMTDAEHARAAVLPAQPVGNGVEGGTAVVHGRFVQRLLSQLLTGVVLCRESRGDADALDLPARFLTPPIGFRSAVHTELQAR